MNQLDAFLDLYGLAAIFVLLLIKSFGVPIPVPNDVLLLATAARAAEGRWMHWQAFLTVLVALVLGGIGQFILVRGPGRKVLYRLCSLVGVTPERLNAAAARVEKSGPLGISLAILTPGLRSVTVVACGLADMPLHVFASGLTLGSGILIGLFFLLGYIGRSLLMSLSISLPQALVILVVIGVVGLLLWLVIWRCPMPKSLRSQIQAVINCCEGCVHRGTKRWAESHFGRKAR
jgi:membrane protein DedA with SNARE-associated domain